MYILLLLKCTAFFLASIEFQVAVEKTIILKMCYRKCMNLVFIISYMCPNCHCDITHDYCILLVDPNEDALRTSSAGVDAVSTQPVMIILYIMMILWGKQVNIYISFNEISLFINSWLTTVFKCVLIKYFWCCARGTNKVWLFI